MRECDTTRTFPKRNTNRSTSGRNARTLDSNSNSHEEIKSTTKRKYRGKYKDSICVFLFVTRFF